MGRAYLGQITRISTRLCIIAAQCRRWQGTGGVVAPFALYKKLCAFLVAHFKPMVVKSDLLQDVELLKYYAAEWDRYTAGAKYLSRVFDFLKYWVQGGGVQGVYPLHTLALLQWRDEFFLHIQKDDNKLTGAVLRQIVPQRNDEVLDQDLLQKVVNSFFSLGLGPKAECLDIYNQHLRDPIVTARGHYYRMKSEELVLAQNSILDYLQEAAECLREEEVWVERSPIARTRKELTSACQNELIHKHAMPMCGSFQTMLDSDQVEDLQRMYVLLSPIPGGLSPLQGVFKEHAKQAGLTAISKLVGEEGVNADVLDLKAYVNALIKVYHTYSETVTQCFRDDLGFAASLDDACREFVNRNAATGTSSTKSAELIANHADMLLRSNNKMAEADLEGVLNRVILLFKYLESKDMFRTFYTIKLAKRLTRGVSVSDESESSMISKLKEACGIQYTNDLQRMITDVSISKDITKSFEEHNSRTHGDKGITFNVMVLAANWPLHRPPTDFVIPAEILATYNSFRQYYQTKHSGRELTWLWNYSNNELHTNYLKKKHILITSSYQMSVLLQYNKNDTLSLDELNAATSIPKCLLSQVLALLVKANIIVNKEIGQYNLNFDFKSKKIRLNLNLPLKVEAKAESPDVKAVTDERNHVLQAAIVRIMKARMTMTSQALIQEVISQISERFVPNVPSIKKAIDTLLEKEYIERVNGSNDTFTYAA